MSNVTRYAIQDLRLSDFIAVSGLVSPLSARGDFTLQIRVEDLLVGRIADNLTVEIGNLAVDAKHFRFDGISLNNLTLIGQGKGTLKAFSGTLSLKTKGEGGNADFMVRETNFAAIADVSIDDQQVAVALKSGSFPFVAELQKQPIKITGSAPASSFLVKWNLASQTLSVAGSLDGGFVQSNNLEIKVSLGNEQIAAAWNGQELTVSGTFRKTRLEPSGSVPFRIPLSFSGNFKLDGRSNLNFSGQASEKDTVRLKFLGRHNSDAQSGNVELEIEPLVFSQGGVQPNQYVPQLDTLISSVSRSSQTECNAVPKAVYSLPSNTFILSMLTSL